MAELTVVKEPIQLQMKDLGKSLSDKIKERQSKILVFGFCGPVGSGISSVEKEVASALKTFNYEVEKIKLSDFIKKHINKTGIKYTDEDLTADTAKRIMLLQDAGNELRHKYVHDILSQFAITEIGARRVQRIDREKPESKGQLQAETPHRVAFLINQFGNTLVVH
jgi:RNase H-fold protein (predicted Holliday junction resolvase)